MLGNVWEWCQDGDVPAVAWKAAIDPVRSLGDPEPRRVIRGGGWGTFAGGCRSRHRNASEPRMAHVNTGFRVVCEVKAGE